MMQRIRVGIVGCGEVTQVMHLPSLAFLTEQFSVSALCDVSKHVLQVVGEQWQVGKRFLDYNDLLAQGDVLCWLLRLSIGFCKDLWPFSPCIAIGLKFERMSKVVSTQHYSLILDIKILLKTVWVALRGKEA